MCVCLGGKVGRKVGVFVYTSKLKCLYKKKIKKPWEKSLASP